MEHFLKNSDFWNRKTYSKFAFLVQLWAQFTPRRSAKSKKVSFYQENIYPSDTLSEYAKIKALSGLDFEWKIQLLFAVFGVFSGKKGPKTQRSRGQRSGQHHFFGSPFIWPNFWRNNFSRSPWQTHVIPALVSFFHFGSHFFDFGPVLSATSPRWKKTTTTIGYSDAEFYTGHLE